MMMMMMKMKGRSGDLKRVAVDEREKSYCDGYCGNLKEGD